MNDTRRAYLVAKVKARNLVNKELIERVPAMIEALKPFIGLQVIKVDGTLLTKVKEALPDLFSDTVAFSGWYNARSYSIYACFKTCVWEGLDHGCVYQEESYCIGELDGAILKVEQRPVDLRYYRTDWTVEEVEKAREEVRKAQEALSEANRPLYHFGMHDN